MKHRPYIGTLAFLLILLFLPAAYSQTAPKIIRVKMTLDEKEPMWNFLSVESDESKIQKALKDRNVKLPALLSPDSKITMTLDEDAVIMILQKSGDGKSIQVTVDTNQNNDLTDEKPFEIPTEEKEGVPPQIFKIKRFSADRSHSLWLPYFIIYSASKGKDGKTEDHYGYTGNYCMDGTFDVNGRPYKIRMWDLLADGKFDKSDLVQGTAISIDLNGDGKFWGQEEFFHGYELIPIAGSYYKIEQVAEDGTQILFQSTELRPANINKPAPDFDLRDTQGKLFRLKDYQGRVLLLDFWASWCKPCVEKFPAVKALIQKYKGKPIEVLGINLDDAERLKNAMKIIKEYDLNWRHVMDGKGVFQPIWQVYGLLPESKMASPLYIVIDGKGVIRAGSNELEKIEKVLNELLVR